MQELINRAKELLADGTVARVLGWKAGDLPYNPEPAYFETEESLKDFVYNGFCGANLSKYMIEASKLEGKTLVFLKPCDTYSFNQLIKEHRVDREKAYIIGVGCKGKLDIERIRKQGIKGIESISGAEITDEAETLTIQTIYGEKTCAYKDAMLERCHVCKGKEHKIYDELIGESKDTKDADRFAEVEKIEAMSPEEMSVLHAAAVNVYSTAISLTVRRKQTWTLSKRRCSISSVHSMWQEDVQTAANAAEYVLREFRFTCSIVNLSKILIHSMVNIRQERIQHPRDLLQTLHLKMLSRVSWQKGDNVCIR
mgnify:CR=1 FL=1